MPDYSNWPYPAQEEPAPQEEAGRTPNYLVGLDLGKTCDPTALAILDRRVEKEEPLAIGARRVFRYDCVHLDRFQLGTPYPEIVGKTKELLAQLETRPILLIDATGVGKAVVDMFRWAKLRARIIAVTFTAGNQVTGDTDNPNVPKKDLVDSLKAILQTKRLEIAQGLPAGKVLKKELQTFAVKVTPAGRETYEAWRQGDHDDVVFAVAMCAWYGENFGWRRFEMMWATPAEVGL
jgi:hypothetical protein